MNTKLILTNWKTTTAGLLGALVIIFEQGQNLLDSSPSTVCDWNTVVAACLTAFALFAARDADKSSEGKKVEPQ